MTALPLLSRRRFLSITSAACLAGPALARADVWQGIALGAKARIVLDHPRAAQLVDRAVAEIDRLEDVFSLYRPASQISRLNRDGRLAAPAFELLDCLATARHVWQISDGLFDPTVQPIWQLLAQARQAGQPAEPEALATARQAVGFDRVRFDSTDIAMDAGQGITLNGIAQGYIADRIAAMMRQEGVSDVLINTGEIVAMGAAPDGGAWPVTIKGETAPRHLSRRALATSAPATMILDPETGGGHILDPRLGPVPSRVRQVSVSAPRAAVADALSTALCLVSDQGQADRTLRRSKDATLESLYLLA